jgi:hypothetical protein
VDSDDADLENKDENGSTLLCVFQRGWAILIDIKLVHLETFSVLLFDFKIRFEFAFLHMFH